MYADTFVQRASIQYRKLFKPYKLPVYPVIQSKEVAIDGQLYMLIGQQSFKKSPFITNFVVYDETGEIANESITSKLYYITMISLFISTLNPLDKTFKKQRKLAFNQDDVIDTHHIGMVPDSIYKAWIDVRKAASFVRKKKQWDEQDLASLL